MPIPQVKQLKRLEGSLALCRTQVVLEPALEQVREGILAMLALGETASTTDGIIANFRQNPALDAEQYRILADGNGVFIEAGGIPGAVYAAATMAQLYMEHEGKLPFCEIADAPEYPWRGFLVDVCRHFFPISTLKTIIDLLAYYKYNRLHLHLSDDQGFRFESERFPLLNSVGSFRKSTFVRHTALQGQDGVPHGGYYTKADLRELVRYAKARGIEIVPEIDMPGHALSMIAAYPDLACFEEQVEVATRFGVTDFSKKLFCAGSERAYEFLFSLLDEVMEVFPFPYVHIGGDEAVKSEWKRCERCQKVMHEQGLKGERELQGYFLNRVIEHLSSHGREAIVWNDGLCDTLDKRAICQYWTPLAHGGSVEFARYVNAGGKAILSPVTRVYYDYPYAATPLKKTYEYNPTLRGIREENQGNILGVEAALWTEWVDTHEKLFFNTLPRLAATAETGWVDGNRAHYDDFLRRLEAHERLYDRLELTHATQAAKPMSLFERLGGTLTFLTKETHTELIDQQMQEKTGTQRRITQMNETLNNLMTRRSIRSFLPKQVEKDLLEQVLEAGTFAPTGGGRQTPVIVAVQDEATVRELSRMNAAVNGNKSDPYYGAPTVLVVLAERSRGTFLLDGASVMTTLVNAAHAVGLGSCWIHRAKEMFESDEGKMLLQKWGIEGDFEGIGQVILGYPAGPAPEPAPRKANYIVRA